MSDAITVNGLVKTFGRVRALDGLDLRVPAGQVHGFLGPNGAGKSTTIRVLLGLMRATGGHVEVLGGDPWVDATALHRRLAYVPSDVALWPNLTGGEVIDLLTRMRSGADPRRRAELIERFELDPTKKARTYSTGHAAPGLRGPLRLAWRLHRRGVLTVAAGLVTLGLVMGSMGATAMTGYADADWVSDWAAAMRLADPADALFVYVIFVFVFISAAHAVLTLLRLRTEEASGIAESLLSTPHSRTQWASSHLCVALAAPLLLQLSLGIGLGIGATAATGDPGELVRALGLTLPLVPAIWVIVGVVLVAFGLSNRAAPMVSWLAMLTGIAAEIAVKAGLPDVVYPALSPFAHVSPYYQPTPLTYLMLTLLATALVAVGLATLRRRDLTRS